MVESLPDVDRLLPQQPPMRLLDRMIGHRGGVVEAEVDVVPAASFFRAGRGIPAWVGMEYLAQAAAAWFTLSAPADRSGDAAPAQAGMLVACRRFECALGEFPEGATLVIRVWPASPASGPLVRFRGEIRLDGAVAAGELSVYLGPAP